MFVESIGSNGGSLFVESSESGRFLQVLSIDAATGQVQWQFNASTPVDASYLQQFLQPVFGNTCELYSKTAAVHCTCACFLSVQHALWLHLCMEALML